jgi:hypothetical protein
LQVPLRERSHPAPPAREQTRAAPRPA